MAQKIENCEHCGKVLPQNEQAYIYEGQVVCHRCNDSLRHPTYVTQTKSVSGLGIAALVLGLIACLGCWIPMCGIFSLHRGIAGLHHDIAALHRGVVSLQCGIVGLHRGITNGLRGL